MRRAGGQKRLAIIAAVGAAVVGVAACSASGKAAPPVGGTGAATASAGSGTVTLSVLERWPEPQYAPYFEKVASDFEKAHPNIKVELTAVPYQSYKSKIQVISSQGKLPDIYYAWPGDFSNRFARAGLAADLSSELAGTAWGSTFHKAAIAGYTYQGKVIGVPVTLNLKAFVYNTQIFQAHHVAVPKTLNDLLSACSTLKAAGVVPIAFGNKDGWPAIHYATSLNAAYVPQNVRDQDYGVSNTSWTNPGYVKALQSLLTIQSKCMPPDANGTTDAAATEQFVGGKAAMYYTSTNLFPTLAKETKTTSVGDNWATFNFPKVSDGTGSQDTVTGAPDGLLVNAKSPHKTEAIEFLKYLTSEPVASELPGATGWISAVKAANTSANMSPQRTAVLKVAEAAPGLNIWLDTILPSEPAQAYTSGLQGLLGGQLQPSALVASVAKASKSVAS